MGFPLAQLSGLMGWGLLKNSTVLLSFGRLNLQGFFSTHRITKSTRASNGDQPVLTLNRIPGGTQQRHLSDVLRGYDGLWEIRQCYSMDFKK